MRATTPRRILQMLGRRRGSANDADVDRERFVKQILLIIDRRQPHQIVACARVQLAAAEARIDECAATIAEQPLAGESTRRHGECRTPCGHAKASDALPIMV